MENDLVDISSSTGTGDEGSTGTQSVKAVHKSSKPNAEMETPVAFREGEEVAFSDLSFYIPLHTAGGQRKMLREKLFPRGAEGAEQQHEIDLEASSVDFKQALKGVTGCAKPGEVLAVMGPSGGGKTTLLHALSGRAVYGTSQGTVLFGGQPRTKNTRKKLGYVMQDDIFFSNLTVRDTLWFTSRIRVPDDIPLREKERRMEDIIRRLGLSRCEHTQIGNQMAKERISGGERKRVNIANELLTDPPILLLDEPTSGLDSNTALTVVKLLKQIAIEQNKTVVTTIHQPNSQMFAEFDKLLLLAEGSVVYFGDAQRAVDYFAEIGYPCPYGFNPADYFLQLLTEEDLNEGEPVKARLKEEWLKRKPHVLPDDFAEPVSKRRTVRETLSSLAKRSSVTRSSPIVVNEASLASLDEEEAPDAVTRRAVPSQGDRDGMPSARKARSTASDGDSRKYPVGWFKQLAILSGRAFRQKRGDYFQALLFIQFLVLTFLVGIVWFQMDPVETTITDRIGLLFFTTVFWGFTSMFQALYALPTERSVIAKDRASGSYAMSAYFLAKTSVELPIELVYPLMYSTAVYWMAGLNPAFWRFVVFVIVLLTTVLAAQSMGLFVSALVMDIKRGQVILTCFMLGSMLVGGYYVNNSNIPDWLGWLKYVSFVQYSFTALFINEFDDSVFACVPGSSTEYSNGGQNCPVTAQNVYDARDLDTSLGFGFSFGILVVFVVVCRFFGYLALRFAHTSHKAKL
eukprot:CAMPEP_0185850942 /NCGR_PEP_ID=MMETSP1354-20130828/4874_1 /TAXON_ID=708628 /ORGANISM="Erythrolobus madagascarensis, Strain CCMP3276" /LENGTH=740 /DNA_ID=CAMNT_0028551673 /DNA_START=159 /DNA_END=2381 /DNA_ORIENTATION=+